MADPTGKAADFRRAVARLTGDRGRRGKHVTRYRIEVGTSDGHRYGLRLNAGNNAPDPPKKDISELRRRLCLRQHGVEAEDVLASWGPDELRSYIRENVTRRELEDAKG